MRADGPLEYLIVFLAAAIVYFVPLWVAIFRKKRKMGAIAVLNLLLGWTVVGWAVALAMAMTHEAPDS